MEQTTGQGVDDARLEGWLHFMRVMMGGGFCGNNKEKAAYRAFVNGALGEDAVKKTEDALTRAIDERLNHDECLNNTFGEAPVKEMLHNACSARENNCKPTNDK